MEYRYPAEWESHEGTWLAWPSNTETWTPSELILVRAEFSKFIHQISLGEKVFLLFLKDSDLKGITSLLESLNTDLSKIEFIKYAFNDSWMRDFGPDFLTGDKYKVINWKYNSWGGKYPPFDGDNNFNNWIAKQKKLEIENIDFVLEGGSVELNGIGDLITTESCLLNPNRNPNFSKQEIETLLKQKYNVKNVIWLRKGLLGDDTDGHIDDMFRFISPTKVIGINILETSHPDYDAIKENRDILINSVLSNGQKIELIDLPDAPILLYEGEQLPASYANFYIANHAVIVPQFGTPNDSLAVAILQQHFPTRKVIGLSSRNIIIGLGSFHCLSKQQPQLI